MILTCFDCRDHKEGLPEDVAAWYAVHAIDCLKRGFDNDEEN